MQIRGFTAVAARYASLLLLLLGLIIAPPSQGTPSRHVLILGDSLSAAYGIDIQAGWAALLQQRLDDAATGCRIVNAAISGETTAGGLARIDALLAQYKPAIVMVQLGANDGLRGLPLDRAKQNLVDIINRSRAAGATPLLLGVRLPPNYGAAFARAFAALYAQVAQQTGVRFSPRLLEGVAEQPALMQADGLHPTAAAQATIRDTVWRLLRPVICDKT